MKLPTAQEMQSLDRCAIEDFNIPGVVLMENAGLGTVRMMEQQLGPCKDTFACIFVGPGNNGGDGLVIGRHLYQRGCRPVFFFLVNPDEIKGDAAINLAIVQKLRLQFHVIDTTSRVETIPVLFKQIESRGLPCYAIVDSIFGIGLDRQVSSRFRSTIELINRQDFAHGVPVVSVDCPSGMNIDSGKVLGACVHADYTATYGCAKPGHFIHDSSELTGRLEIIDIGIPPDAVQRIRISNELVDRRIIGRVSDTLIRKNSSHKGNHGHLLIIAGSPGKTGAAMLSARGALRGGCGLVSLLVPNQLNSIFETNLVEAMTIPLPNSPDHFTATDIATAAAQLETKQATVIGPGIGTHPETAEFVLALYQNTTIPMVVDADALNILAASKESIGHTAGLRIFTPHPGELGRLLDCSIADIQDNRLEAARQACSRLNSDTSHNIVVVKGAGTIIASPEGTTLINTSGNPGMATGGMGDVLCGIIGALLCQGVSPLQATAAAVYLHGAAADVLYERNGVGYTAGEVADALPTTLKSLLEEEMP